MTNEKEQELLDKAEQWLAKAYLIADLTLDSAFAKAALLLDQFKQRLDDATPAPAVENERPFLRPEPLSDTATLQEKLDYIKAMSVETPFEDAWHEVANVDEHSLNIQEAYMQLRNDPAVWDEWHSTTVEKTTDTD